MIDAPIALASWVDAMRTPESRTGEPDSDRSIWLEYRGIAGPNCNVTRLAIPAAQYCEQTEIKGSTVLACADGAVDVHVGEAVYRLRERDLLALPAGRSIKMRNLNDHAAAFIGQVRALAGLATTNATGDLVQHIRWDTSLRQMTWTYPLANTWGYRRGSGPYVSPKNLRGHMVLLPLGQGSPWHHAPRDLYFLGMKGVVEFHSAGMSKRLGHMDVLYIRTSTPYRFINVSVEDAHFLSIGGAPVRGAKGVYFEEDPGWPIRPDAKVMDTDADPYADVRG